MIDPWHVFLGAFFSLAFVFDLTSKGRGCDEILFNRQIHLLLCFDL